MTDSPEDDETRRFQTVGRVLDSRWMLALAVSAVLVAIVWALLDDGLGPPREEVASTPTHLATVELLGVPDDARVMLDGHEIENQRFSVSPGTRHLLEVEDDRGRTWRQVFLASGSLSLVVELRTHFTEVEVDPAADDRARD